MSKLGHGALSTHVPKLGYSIEETLDCLGADVSVFSAGGDKHHWAWAFTVDGGSDGVTLETFHVGYSSQDEAWAAAWEWRRESLEDSAADQAEWAGGI